MLPSVQDMMQPAQNLELTFKFCWPNRREMLRLNVLDILLATNFLELSQKVLLELTGLHPVNISMVIIHLDQLGVVFNWWQLYLGINLGVCISSTQLDTSHHFPESTGVVDLSYVTGLGSLEPLFELSLTDLLRRCHPGPVIYKTTINRKVSILEHATELPKAISDIIR